MRLIVVTMEIKQTALAEHRASNRMSQFPESLVTFARRQANPRCSPYDLQPVTDSKIKTITGSNGLCIQTRSGIIDISKDGRYIQFSLSQAWREESRKFELLRSITLFKNFYIRRGFIRYRNRVKRSVFERNSLMVSKRVLSFRFPFKSGLEQICLILSQIAFQDVFRLPEVSSIPWERLIESLDRDLIEFDVTVKRLSSQIQDCLIETVESLTTEGHSEPESPSYDTKRLSISKRRDLERTKAKKRRELQHCVTCIPQFKKLIALRIRDCFQVIIDRTVLRLESILSKLVVEVVSGIDTTDALVWIHSDEIRAALNKHVTIVEELLLDALKYFSEHARSCFELANLHSELDRLITACSRDLEGLKSEKFAPIISAHVAINKMNESDTSFTILIRRMTTLSEVRANLVDAPEHIRSGIFVLDNTIIINQLKTQLGETIHELSSTAVLSIRCHLRATHTQIDACSKDLMAPVSDIEEYVKARQTLSDIESTTLPNINTLIEDLKKSINELADHAVRLSSEDTYVLENINGRAQRILNEELPRFRYTVRSYSTRAEQVYMTLVSDYNKSLSAIDDRISNLLQIDPLGFPPLDNLKTDIKNQSISYATLVQLGIGIGNETIKVSDPSIYNTQVEGLEKDFEQLRDLIETQTNFKSLPLSGKRVSEFTHYILEARSRVANITHVTIKDCFEMQVNEWVDGKLDVLKAITDENWGMQQWENLGKLLGSIAILSQNEITFDLLEEISIFSYASVVQDTLTQSKRIKDFENKWARTPLPLCDGQIDLTSAVLLRDQMEEEMRICNFEEVEALNESLRYLGGLCQLMTSITSGTSGDINESQLTVCEELAAADLSVLSWYKSCPTTCILIEPYLRY